MSQREKMIEFLEKFADPKPFHGVRENIKEFAHIVKNKFLELFPEDIKLERSNEFLEKLDSIRITVAKTKVTIGNKNWEALDDQFGLLRQIYLETHKPVDKEKIKEKIYDELVNVKKYPCFETLTNTQRYHLQNMFKKI